MAKQIKLISEIFNVNTGNFGVEVETDHGQMVPALNPHYGFDLELLKKGLLWQDPRHGEQNLLLTGPTGAGKTSFVEQLCARLGVQVWRVMCHGRMEFQELLGGFKLVAKQTGGTETVWCDGPLIQAAKAGGTLLLDEGNFISPAAIGGLNSVLDGAPILIPETGELVRPAEGFRVAFTGNAVNGGDDVSSYRGTQRMNMALLDRFMTLEVGYLPELEEAKILNRVLPMLPGNMISGFLKVTSAIRALHIRGDLETTLSTRVILRWAKLYLMASPKLTSTRAKALWALDFAHLQACRPEERGAIQQQVELVFEA